MSVLRVNSITGKDDDQSSGFPITLSGDTATLGAGVTISAAGITGALPVGVTGGAGLTSLKLARNEKLVVKYVSATTVDIDADYLTVFDSSNVGTVLSSINLTATITTAGLNGLDTGAEAASTWYHIWVIYNGTTTASLLSASSTAPTMPSGYTYKKYVGAVYNNSSSNFKGFFQNGNTVQIAQETAFSAASTTSWVTVTFAPIVPITAHSISGSMQNNYSSSGNTERLDIAAYVDASSVAYGVHGSQVLIFGSTTRSFYRRHYQLTLIVPQTYYVKSTYTGRSCDAQITQWDYLGIV
jgi:F0F1-type ATP synthase membrane subunit c/vacuolar-type H+-ATPase subunit K